MTQSSPTPILCVIHAEEHQSADLASVVTFCSSQTGFAIEVVTHASSDPKPVVTLHLAPERASADNPVWCLVCRLACLCPQARVGALIYAHGAFIHSRATLHLSA